MKTTVTLTLVVILLVVPIMTVACRDNTASPPPFFPVLKQPESAYPQALARAWLKLDDNCLRLKSFYFFGKGILLIWPYGYSLDIKGKEIRVINRDGEVVARVGDWIKVGGGEIPLEIVEKYIGEPLPDNCVGPYWLVSGVIEE